jgi:hypothetical protein
MCLGAVALVGRDSKIGDSVVNACHFFIRKGDVSRIPELRELLLLYGDKALAEDYLNCGRVEMHDAAAAWGRAHGYNIQTGAGSNRVRWGSGK